MNFKTTIGKIKWAILPKKREGAYLNKRVDGLDLPAHIVPMQKSIPPYMPVLVGYGYQGVLLYNTTDDSVQCHICGEWFRSVGQHLPAHKIQAKVYKDKFGLYRNQPLSGLETKRKYREVAIKRNKKYKTQKNLTGGGRLNGMKKCNSGRAKKGAMSIQFQNQYGSCEAQLRNRVKAHVEKYGFFPRSTSDNMLSTMLWRRFGSIENAKVYYGYK